MTPPLVTLAAAEAYALLWQGALAAAQRGLAHVEGEALHDFRVAVRRLRVVVSHYGAPGARQQKLLRRLKQITAKTNSGRDNEVMLAWLEQQWPALSSTERKGARCWRRKLKRAGGAMPTMARLQRGMQAVATQLITLPVNESIAASAFGCVVAQQLQRESGRLQDLMESGTALAQLHHLRLQAKEVRYLLTPFREEVAVCGAAEQQLQQMQELLGAWHDSVICQQSLHRLLLAHIVALQHDTARAVRHGEWQAVAALDSSLAGLLTLQRLNLKRQHTTCAALTRDYLADGATALAEVLQRAAAALRGQAAMGEPNRLP